MVQRLKTMTLKEHQRKQNTQLLTIRIGQNKKMTPKEIEKERFNKRCKAIRQ